MFKYLSTLLVLSISFLYGDTSTCLPLQTKEVTVKNIASSIEPSIAFKAEILTFDTSSSNATLVEATTPLLQNDQSSSLNITANFDMLFINLHMVDCTNVYGSCKEDNPQTISFILTPELTCFNTAYRFNNSENSSSFVVQINTENTPNKLTINVNPNDNFAVCSTASSGPKPFWLNLF